MKRCPECGEEKVDRDFYRCARAKDGLQSRCKKCDARLTREWRAKNPERFKAQQRRANTKGRERRLRWQRENRDRLNRRRRERRADDPERAQAESRRYHRMYREADRERSRRWRQENPERKRAYKYARRQRLRGMDFLALEYAEILRGDLCSYCGAPAEHIDHIDCLAEGGPHRWDNLTSACADCNQRKRTRSLLIHLTVMKEEI